MPVSATVSNQFKYALATGAINLNGDTLKILLMRDGFVFDKDNHASRMNLKGSRTADTLAINSSLQLTDSAGGFITAGFVPGNQITMTGWTNGGNNTTKIIATVSAGTITFTNPSGLVPESAGNTVMINADDELATGNGYVQDNKVLSNITLTKDLDNDRVEMTCGNPTWTASGGSIGPTPGAIIYDDTSTGDIIIGYLDFGGPQTASDGADFAINNIKLRLL